MATRNKNKARTLGRFGNAWNALRGEERMESIKDQIWREASKGGEGSISEANAMKSPAVYRAVTFISETIAHLPLELKKRSKDGTMEDITDHPLLDVIARPIE